MLYKYKYIYIFCYILLYYIILYYIILYWALLCRNEELKTHETAAALAQLRLRGHGFRLGRHSSWRGLRQIGCCCCSVI